MVGESLVWQPATNICQINFFLYLSPCLTAAACVITLVGCVFFCDNMCIDKDSCNSDTGSNSGTDRYNRRHLLSDRDDILLQNYVQRQLLPSWWCRCKSKIATFKARPIICNAYSSLWMILLLASV